MKTLFLSLLLIASTSIVNLDACTPLTDSSPILLSNGFLYSNIESDTAFWFATYIDSSYPFYSGSGGNQLWYQTPQLSPVYSISTALHVVAVSVNDGYDCFLDELDNLGL